MTSQDILSLQPLFSDWSITRFKEFRGHDGGGFNLNLLLKGKMVAQVDNDGWGGGFSYRWLDKGAEEAFTVIVASLPKWVDEEDPEFPQLFPEGLDYDMDMAIEEFLIDPFVQNKQWKAACKRNGNTVIRLHSLKKGEYITIYQACTPDVKEGIRKKYGEDLIEIVNDRYIAEWFPLKGRKK
ncbi:MAG: hypothetical protein WC291_05675 [Thermodesulfovibrionales bacterium]|jgi:hypothetical protein